jgi:hypothetical protein
MSSQVSDPVHLQGLDAPPERTMGWCPDPLSESDLRWWNGNEWSSHVRPHEWAPPDRLMIWGLVLGIVVPFAGAVIGVVLLTRNKLGPGFACLATAALGAVIWIAVSGS